MDQISPSAILTTPRQFLDKLRWEIEGLRAEPDETIGRYRTFNCVVTAWHAAEILHKVMTPEQRGKLAARTGFDIAKPGREGLSAFQTYLREHRPAEITQQFANNSKHLYVDKHTDLDLSYTASAVGVTSVSHTPFIYKVIDKSERIIAADMFDDFHRFLTSLLEEAEGNTP